MSQGPTVPSTPPEPKGTVLPPRYPVLWLTVLAFVATAAASLDVFVGCLLLVVVLPGVLLAQAGIRWGLRRLHTRVWLRRSLMLAPALVLALGLFILTGGLGGRQTQAVAGALAGRVPEGIRNLHVHEDIWTDQVLHAYFQCDPVSLRRILESPPFARVTSSPRGFSFSQTPFAELRSRADVQDAVVFERTDLGAATADCKVYTDSKFSFAYIVYGID